MKKSWVLFVFLLMFSLLVVAPIGSSIPSDFYKQLDGAEDETGGSGSQAGGGTEDELQGKNDTGMWKYIKEKASAPIEFVNNKIGFVFGTRNFEGKSITGLDYFKSGQILYWLFFGLAVGLWMFLFFWIQSTFDKLRFKDSLFWVRGELFNSLRGFIIFLLIIIGIYTILGGIPILNRLVQIISFEFIPLHWFWRSLIIATLIYFSPVLTKAYIGRRKRMKIYKDKLEAQAIKAINKTQLP